MSWSLSSVSFRMAGAGDWQSLLPDEQARQLYAGMYPKGTPLARVDASLRPLLTRWQDAGIVEVDGQKVVPRAPIMTEGDIELLAPWFRQVSDSMCAAIGERLSDYTSLAESISRRGSSPGHDTGNLLTILICAQTLDILAFKKLRRELLGPHPPRGDGGNFFFWGYGFGAGPKRIFGVTTYGRGLRMRLSVLRSRGLDRGAMPALLGKSVALDYLRSLRLGEPAFGDEILSGLRSVGIVEEGDPPRLAIPVFTAPDMEIIDEPCSRVSDKIVSGFADTPGKLKQLIERCSFSGCSIPDILCMLFHLVYSYAADSLVEAGIVPEFPKKAGGEWGVWVHEHDYL